MLEIVDILNGGSKDETREHHTDAVGGIVLLHVLPDSQFTELLSGAVTDVGIVHLSCVLECDLKGEISF